VNSRQRDKESYLTTDPDALRGPTPASPGPGTVAGEPPRRHRSYSDLTFSDPNPIKRFLQRSRLTHAMRMARRVPAPRTILDFGAGNGELCKYLRSAFPHARILCYEPAPQLLEEARENLPSTAGIDLLPDLDGVKAASVDLAFSLEVFEHLPPRETADALARIDGLLSPHGRLIIGVPVEVGVPALYKGLFRMIRRYGEFDATVANVFACAIGRPPLARPRTEIAAGLHYHTDHVGFDHRRFHAALRAIFDVEALAATPWPVLGTAFNPEVYYLAARPRTPARRAG
jgi:trans-aconitate methyltransferase